MGEHGGPFHKAAYAYLKFEEIARKGDYKSDMPADELRALLKTPDNFSVATAGGVRIEDIRSITRLYIEAIGNPLRQEDSRWGFKEVVTPDTGATVAELYPRSQIVCLLRDPVDCIDSIVRCGWWGRHLEWIIDDVWMAKFKDFHALAINYPGQVMVKRYERLAEDLPDVFKWLELTWTNAHQAMLDGEHVGSAATVGPRPDCALTDEEKVFIREACKIYYNVT